MKFPYFRSLLERNPFVDALLSFEGGSFMVSKVILCGQNEYFYNLFINNETKYTFDLKHINLVDFRMYYEYLHIGDGYEITIENIEHLFNIQKAFKIVSLESKLKKWIKNKCNIELLTTMFNMTLHYNLRQYHTLINKLIHNNFETLTEINSFDILSKECIFEIFTPQIIRNKDQKKMLYLITQWVNADFQKRQDEYLNLLLLINFENLSTIFVRKYIKENQKIHESSDIAEFLFKIMTEKLSINIVNCDDSKICLFGGQNYSNSVVTMDLITKEIKIAGQLLNGRKSHTSSRIDNHAYIWGGYCCKKIERYDVHTNKTQEIKCRLDNVIDSLSSVVHDSKLFQIGGFSCKKTIDTVKYLDFEKCAFINESKLIVPDMWHDSIVIDSNIYTTPGAYCKNIQRRDLRERNWQLMRKVIPNKTYRNAVCSLGQTNIVCIGGWNLDSEVYSDCFVFDIRADDWRQIEPLPKALKAAQACETTKEIIVFGGIQSDHTYDSCINEILCYDKNENTWTKLDQNLPFPNGWSTKVTF